MGGLKQQEELCVLWMCRCDLPNGGQHGFSSLSLLILKSPKQPALSIDDLLIFGLKSEMADMTFILSITRLGHNRNLEFVWHS